MAETKDPDIQAMADEIFELSNLGSLARSRSGESLQLTETEYIALDLLSKQEPQAVGELQRQIGVLPAQMSRILRSLEDKGGAAFLACKINSEDRRKIDVFLTPAGRKAREQYRSARTALTLQILSDLSDQDREVFISVLRKIRKTIHKRLQGK
jgi:DNA-binding MarR family transcriptional regulator